VGREGTPEPSSSSFFFFFLFFLGPAQNFLRSWAAVRKSSTGFPFPLFFFSFYGAGCDEKGSEERRPFFFFFLRARTDAVARVWGAGLSKAGRSGAGSGRAFFPLPFGIGTNPPPFLPPRGCTFPDAIQAAPVSARRGASFSFFFLAAGGRRRGQTHDSQRRRSPPVLSPPLFFFFFFFFLPRNWGRHEKRRRATLTLPPLPLPLSLDRLRLQLEPGNRRVILFFFFKERPWWEVIELIEQLGRRLFLSDSQRVFSLGTGEKKDSAGVGPFPSFPSSPRASCRELAPLNEREDNKGGAAGFCFLFSFSRAGIGSHVSSRLHGLSFSRPPSGRHARKLV